MSTFPICSSGQSVGTRNSQGFPQLPALARLLTLTSAIILMEHDKAAAVVVEIKNVEESPYAFYPLMFGSSPENFPVHHSTPEVAYFAGH